MLYIKHIEYNEAAAERLNASANDIQPDNHGVVSDQKLNAIADFKNTAVNTSSHVHIADAKAEKGNNQTEKIDAQKAQNDNTFGKAEQHSKIGSTGLQGNNTITNDKTNGTNPREHLIKNNVTDTKIIQIQAVDIKTSRQQSNDSISNKAILTLFTTFANNSSKEQVYKNTILNWKQFGGKVNLILFQLPGETFLAEFAKQHGWHTMQAKTIPNGDTPLLKHMFMAAENQFSSEFYGYANGDILFNQRLVETLETITPVTSKMKTVLITGKRTNFNLTTNNNFHSFDEVTKNGKLGELYKGNAQDYFLTTREGYPWEEIPNFIVGHLGYDNWILVNAIHKGMAVIDATNTILALHQTDSEGNKAGM